MIKYSKSLNPHKERGKKQVYKKITDTEEKEVLFDRFTFEPNLLYAVYDNTEREGIYANAELRFIVTPSMELMAIVPQDLDNYYNLSIENEYLKIEIKE